VGIIQSYRLRLQRKRWRIRAIRKRRELKRVADRTSRIKPDDLLLFCTQRNEKVRLPYFLNYYRDMGVGHFFFVDNDSTDGSDEFLVYPFCDTRPLRALTDWLDASSIKSFSAMLLDMYPKGRIDDQPYIEGTNPIEIASWFDSGNYTMSRNHRFNNLWIQGGPRARVFFGGSWKFWD